MEYASVLAGERFSDSPRCTDPVLAAVARCVNDYSTDAARQRLAPLAGDLTTANGAGDDVRVRMVRRCLIAALRHTSGPRREVVVVALLGLDRAAAGHSHGWDDTMLSLDTEVALLGAGADAAAAAGYVADLPVCVDEHSRRALPVDIEMAISTIAQHAADADEVLYRLLVECLDDYRAALAEAQPSRLAWTSDSTS
jgi:hypothetical protein